MIFIKDPDAELDYAIDWSAWLAAEEDTAASAEWFVPDGLTGGATSLSEGKATIWLSGGTVQTEYIVVCRLTTTGGLKDDRSIVIAVHQR